MAIWSDQLKKAQLYNLIYIENRHSIRNSKPLEYDTNYFVVSFCFNSLCVHFFSIFKMIFSLLLLLNTAKIELLRKGTASNVKTLIL